MAVPKFDKFLTPVLMCLSDGKEYSIKEIIEYCIRYYALSEDDINEKLTSGSSRLKDRVGWARTYLKQAGIIKSIRRGIYQITDEGSDLISTKKEISPKDLLEYPAFQSFLNRKNSCGSSETNTKEIDILEFTPTEQLERAVTTLNDELATRLLEMIQKKVSDYEFEKLAIRLLIHMGYGEFQYNKNAVTQKSKDAGIDGIISSDKLGLDRIYIQVKKWHSNNKIGRPVLQSFLGACYNNDAKMIFITTSEFTADAVEFASSLEKTGKKMVLIDGRKLAKLMIEYNFGVSVERTYFIKKIDTDFFDEYE